MFGKLTLEAIPYHEPIIMAAVGGAILGGIFICALITYYGKWMYLWREWITSVDHKRIGIMYIIFGVVMLLRGFADALMMRAQQAIAVGGNEGYLNPHHYDQIFTAHGIIMIIFVAMPIMVGLINIVVPLQIGARDVAFPFLNSLSFWLTAFSGGLVMVSLAIGEFSQAGWTGYPPLSELAYSPGTGVDYWIWSLQIGGVGTLITAVNFVVTVLKMRAPGMTAMKMPIFTWASFTSMVLVLFAFPVLTVTLALLSLDRYMDMHFFTNDLGGNMMMYLNLFWIWGHPEVYIVILPAFGIFSEVIATYSKKRLFGYTSMVWALLVILILSFIVWLHHFFTMGAGPKVNAAFGIATMVIAIPTGAKIFNWLFTMYRGRVTLTTPVMWTIGFIITFSVGGMTGVMLAMPAADFVLHNSLFLIAHFHNMLIPALFGYFAGLVYWFPKAFGFKLNERLGKWSFWCWLIGFLLAFIPLYMLGFMGMTRRLNHYDNPAWQPYLIVAAIGALVILAGVALQFAQVVVSFIKREEYRDVTGDAWDGRTLEWTTSSPPPFYNFAVTPTVDDIDPFWSAKENGTAYQRPAKYEKIHMPKNTSVGFIIGALSFIFGFAFIWHIWWLVGASMLGMLGALIARSFDEDTDYYVPAEEVQRIEEQRFQDLAAANAGVK